MMDQDLRTALDQNKLVVELSLQEDRKNANWAIHSIRVYTPEKCEPGKIPVGTLVPVETHPKFKSQEEATAVAEHIVRGFLGAEDSRELIIHGDVDTEIV